MLFVIAGLFLLGFAFTGGWFSRDFFHPKNSSNQSSDVQRDIYLSFLTEVYDTILTNYWNKIPEDQLVNLFQLSTESLIAKPFPDQYKTKDDFLKLMKNALAEIKPEKKKEFTVTLTDMVLAHLEPFNRSRLYTQKDETSLSENVQNINRQTDRYEILGVGKNASSDEIQKKYEEKTKDLKTKNTPEAKQQLAEVEKAYQTLADEKNRQLYNQSGIEPTIIYKLVHPDILYLHLTKFSPTTLDELKNVTEKFDKDSGPTSLILDLRSNIGGSIDLLPYFLGPFIGPDQYAYQFFHQGEKTDYKTRTGWLASLTRYKKTVVLVNQETQSTAEVAASVLKKYNVGVLVGTTTKGWGTIEKVFPLTQQIDQNEKYSIFLVHSLTLKEDGQPIEGKGVEPAINIKDPDWEKQLYNYWHYQELVAEVQKIINQPD